ncbi:hypothetical protein GCM10009801_05550 [Streptomyces albiaxialis]|uniref:Uncharacterized protein n=1 Tax=Streptomyces albiaxialis TaxID=329523 RepID=A0ABN2VH67_9ACTN
MGGWKQYGFPWDGQPLSRSSRRTGKGLRTGIRTRTPGRTRTPRAGGAPAAEGAWGTGAVRTSGATAEWSGQASGSQPWFPPWPPGLHESGAGTAIARPPTTGASRARGSTRRPETAGGAYGRYADSTGAVPSLFASAGSISSA